MQGCHFYNFNKHTWDFILLSYNRLSPQGGSLSWISQFPAEGASEAKTLAFTQKRNTHDNTHDYVNVKNRVHREMTLV